MMILFLLSGVGGGAVAAGTAAYSGYGILACLSAYVLGGWAGMGLVAAPVLLRKEEEQEDLHAEDLLDEELLLDAQFTLAERATTEVAPQSPRDKNTTAA
ncbi:hypothetical protein SAMN05421688_0711 [Poseidonocella pacifica]|uniref:Uncharacterized protein n=1 Tax=Poseidonocella pacifica TaxID=871651 RepID=A0A1I0VKT6_9RHOB|nr:hypothetical protein [Poseidonocella pacifica]SFA76637.1 hypothetical protein SAMN05421688_0711 [Poseidonocella pacifica]